MTLERSLPLSGPWLSDVMRLTMVNDYIFGPHSVKRIQPTREVWAGTDDVKALHFS